MAKGGHCSQLACSSCFFGQACTIILLLLANSTDISAEYLRNACEVARLAATTCSTYLCIAVLGNHA